MLAVKRPTRIANSERAVGFFFYFGEGKYFGKGHIPVLGVAFDGGTDAANAAARLSIEELPGNPVILAPGGAAYFGSEGFFNACVAAVKDEFFVVPTPTKEAKHNVPLV